MILKQTRAPHVRLSVPDHKAIKRGLLRAIIREAALTREQFELLAQEVKRPRPNCS